MVRSKLLLAAVGALLLAVAAAAPASAPSTAGEGQGGALAATPAKYGNGTDLQKAVPENTPAKNIASNLDSTVDLSATTSSSVTGGESGLPPLPKEHEPTPEEIAEFEALFSKGKQSEEVSEETSKEKRKRERKEKKKRMEQEKKEEEERERREKEEKKKRREQEKKEEEERERRENEEREKEEKVVEERVKEKKVKEEHERKEQEREPEEEREKEKKLEEERVKEKEVEEVHERKQQGNNDDVDIVQREGKQKQDDTEKNSNDENTGEGSSSSEGSSVTADTPIASKSVQSALGVSESSSPLVSAVAQPQPQPQAAAWTAASSWGPAPASQGSAAQPASSSLGQPRSASQTFNIISSSPISYPGTASQSVAPPTPENSGRYTLNVSPPPVPREKIISSYLRDVFQFSDTKQLLDSLKNGQPLQPQDYKGVTVNLKVTGYDGKPVVNQVGPWTSRPYTAPPAPATPAAPAPTFAPAAPAAAATPNAALQDVTYPLYFLNFQGRQLPVYDSNVDTAKVLAQLEQLNQIHQQQQETLRQLREQMQQELQLAQQPTLYHRPPVDPPAKDTQVIQVPVPTELESVEGSSGKILQPIKTSQAILTIPSSPDQQLVERGLSSASTSLLQPIPASGPVFSIQGPMTVVANQGAQGPSPAWQSYSSPGLSSGASATPSSVYNAAGAAAASPASHAPYKGVLTPGVPASLEEYAKSLTAGGAPSGSADNAPSSGAASSVTYSAASSSSSGAATSGSPDPLAQLKSQPTAGGSSSSSAPLASPNRITFTIPGANFVPSSTQYSQYSSAPQQVFTFTSSAAAPGTANYLVPGTIPDVSAIGTSGVLRQLPAGYQTTFLAPTQQQQQQTTTWAQRPPYTVSVYATQTKS